MQALADEPLFFRIGLCLKHQGLSIEMIWLKTDNSIAKMLELPQRCAKSSTGIW